MEHREFERTHKLEKIKSFYINLIIHLVILNNSLSVMVYIHLYFIILLLNMCMIVFYMHTGIINFVLVCVTKLLKMRYRIAK